MLIAALVSLFATDWALALVGVALFPSLLLLNVVYSAADGASAWPTPSSCGPR